MCGPWKSKAVIRREVVIAGLILEYLRSELALVLAVFHHADLIADIFGRVSRGKRMTGQSCDRILELIDKWSPL